MKSLSPVQDLDAGSTAQTHSIAAPEGSVSRALEISGGSGVSAESDADARHSVALRSTIAYAAPALGSGFFYIPMWSIVPGMYVKYFGLKLTSVAACVLAMRIYDGVLDTTVGYLSDWHRSRGGLSRTWVMAGALIFCPACYFLFNPPAGPAASYYLTCSLLYFTGFALSEIAHNTWGSLLTMDYEGRARVFGVRNILQKIGIGAFYSLPLLPLFRSRSYTPEVLQTAFWVGTVLNVLGIAYAYGRAPKELRGEGRGDTRDLRLIVQTVLRNRPLIIYLGGLMCGAVCFGMWFGLLFFYLDGYLGVGESIAGLLLTATICSFLSTPLWVALIAKTSKTVAWATGVLLFTAQLAVSWFVHPGTATIIALVAVVVANTCFSCYDVATFSILGDIVDYGRLKFHQDRCSTYIAINTLVFKIGLGIGGGLALGVASLFDFSPAAKDNSSYAIFGLKAGFILLPAVLGLVSLLFIVRTPINRRRHRIIQTRLETRLARGEA